MRPDPTSLIVVIDDVVRTDDVAELTKTNKGYTITFEGEDRRTYRYGFDRARALRATGSVEVSAVVPLLEGKPLSRVVKIITFPGWKTVEFAGGTTRTYADSKLRLDPNCLSAGTSKDVWSYLEEAASIAKLPAQFGNERNDKTNEGRSFLKKQYESIAGIGTSSLLGRYLSGAKSHAQLAAAPGNPSGLVEHDLPLIYPFGLNTSQKAAIENAFASDVSFVQGPPGTGKTQTLLNIIAIAVLEGKSVAVVSNNNSAVENVRDKLAEHDLDFLCAYLGRKENKQAFVANQTGRYPDMVAWHMDEDERLDLLDHIVKLSSELDSMLETRNDLALSYGRLDALKKEQAHQDAAEDDRQAQPEVAAFCSSPSASTDSILDLIARREDWAAKREGGRRPSLLRRVVARLHLGRIRYQLLIGEDPAVSKGLYAAYYTCAVAEEAARRTSLERRLDQFDFDAKVEELRHLSMRYLKGSLARKFAGISRQVFEAGDLFKTPAAFAREYPVVLSSTYSIRNCLSKDFVFDYLLMDEASQVNIQTGALALSCARNVVIVGDEMQLPNVVTIEDAEQLDRIRSHYDIPVAYDVARQSFLSSALHVWPDAPCQLLREHYRCHPKIIGFCNERYYRGELIVMTRDHGEPDVLELRRMAPGIHARGHFSQRQVDDIVQEVLPHLKARGLDDVGIIAPYKAQAEAIRKAAPGYQVATVHKFQGREKKAVVLSTVDDTLGDFAGDPNLLNVAVSRAELSLTVLLSANEGGDQGNDLEELAHYIEYNGFKRTDSPLSSVFDLLFDAMAERRAQYLKGHDKVSTYDSENLMAALLDDILNEEGLEYVAYACHVPLALVESSWVALTDEESAFAWQPNAHLDFLLYRKLGKIPLLAVEVDGWAFHQEGSRQAARDALKNAILDKCGLPLLRFKTTGAGERERLVEELHRLVKG